MKRFLPYVLCLVIGALLMWYFLPTSNEEKKRLQSEVKALLKEDGIKAGRINMLSSEIDKLKQEKEAEHQKVIEALAQTIIYKKRYENYKIMPVLHYTGKQRDSVISSIVAESRSRQRIVGRIN